MHYLRALTLASAGFGLASASALPASLLKRGATIPASMRLTDTIASIDLDQYERSLTADTNPLEKRVDVKICSTTASAGVCVALGTGLTTFALGIAALVKGNSNGNDCSPHSGGVNNVTWKVYATGNNCDTTAQLDTISGAVTKYIDSQDDQVCGVHCLKLSHGGTWEGYVTIASSGEDLDSYYCGSSNSFGDCLSGGSNDNHTKN